MLIGVRSIEIETSPSRAQAHVPDPEDTSRVVVDIVIRIQGGHVHNAGSGYTISQRGGARPGV